MPHATVSSVLAQPRHIPSRVEPNPSLSIAHQPTSLQSWGRAVGGTGEGATVTPSTCRNEIPVSRAAVLALIGEYALGWEPHQLGLFHGLCDDAASWLVQRGPRPVCSSRCLGCLS